MKKNRLKTMLMALTIGGFILSVPATISLAAGSNKTSAPAKAAAPQSPNIQGGNRQFGGRNQFDIKPVLDKLVKAKTITAAQETKIIAYEKKMTDARIAQMQKFQKMTDAERQAARAKQQQITPGKRQGQNTYADLVKAKTLTQKQADAITKAVAAARPSFRNRQGNGGNGGNWGNGNNGNNGNSN
jgi:hypothetical protein